MTVAGLVLAAGAGIRMGRPKAALVVDGEGLAARAARVLAEAGCEPVVVVLGAASVDVPGEVVVNDAWAEGMGSSLRCGLAALAQRAERAVVLLCDQPGIGVEAVAAVIARAPAGAGALAAASYGGRRGHPVLLGADHWAEVARGAVGDVGARPYLDARAGEVVEVPCDDLADPRDLDVPEDLVGR